MENVQLVLNNSLLSPKSNEPFSLYLFTMCWKHSWKINKHPVSLRGGQTFFFMAFHTILNYCVCAISSRELSVCAIFYAFSNYTVHLRTWAASKYGVHVTCSLVKAITWNKSLLTSQCHCDRWQRLRAKESTSPRRPGRFELVCLIPNTIIFLLTNGYL